MYIYISYIYIYVYLFGVRIAFIKGSLDETSQRFIWKFSSSCVNAFFVCTNKHAVLKGISCNSRSDENFISKKANLKI